VGDLWKGSVTDIHGFRAVARLFSGFVEKTMAFIRMLLEGYIDGQPTMA
jgi:hypothetical protein